jgi:uncharacterized membrane protein YdjX (TVP38/TMEM64 family)
MKLKSITKLLLFLFLISLIITISIYNSKFIDHLENVLGWVDRNIFLGLILYLVVQLLLSLLFLPTTPLAIGMSFVLTEIYSFKFGFLFSYILLTIATITSSIICFYISRYIFQNEIEFLIEKYPKLSNLNHMMDKDGIKMTIFLRISPLVPFSPLNYFLGSSNITFKDYIKGTIFGTFFWILLFCFLGSSVSSIKDAVSAEFFGKNLYILILIVIFGIISSFGTMYIVRKTNNMINDIVERDIENQPEIIQVSEIIIIQ